MSTVLEEQVDLEQFLANDETRHFRSTHRACVPSLIPGMILESNCGVLFRIRGVTLERIDRCGDCVRNELWRSCPVCGDILL